MTFKTATHFLCIITAFVFGAIVTPSAMAIPVFQNSAVVSNVTNSATFDSITSNGINLNGYTEDGIIVDVPDISFIGIDAFNTGSSQTAFHYGREGNNNWVTISMADGSSITALDFLLGDGYLGSTTNLLWETFVGTTSMGFGDLVLDKGTTVGWTDTSGFTSIRVAAHGENIVAFGELQAIALDNLNIDTTLATVPVPAAVWLFSSGVIGLIGVARRKSRV